MGYISELRKTIGSRPIISVGATVLVTNNQQEVLFQHRSDTHDWGLPGGSMELGETRLFRSPLLLPVSERG